MELSNRYISYILKFETVDMKFMYFSIICTLVIFLIKLNTLIHLSSMDQYFFLGTCSSLQLIFTKLECVCVCVLFPLPLLCNFCIEKYIFSIEHNSNIFPNTLLIMGYEDEFVRNEHLMGMNS